MRCMPTEEGFLGIEAKDAVSYQDARAIIIPFGLESSVTYGKGTSLGPAAIIRASHEVELFDEYLWCEPFRRVGIVTLHEPMIEQETLKALEQLEKIVRQVLNDQKFPLVLGGEHTITAGAIRPFIEKYEDLILLHFDAHADLRNAYHGNHYSHASAIRRCLDHAKLKAVSVGVRNISAEEIPFVEENRHRLHIYWGKDKKKWNVKEITSHLKGLPIYITFDVDGFDSSVMPATGTPEPGGLFWDEVIEIITAASQVGTIVGADINELAPIPYLHSCDFLVAKLAYKILSLI